MKENVASYTWIVHSSEQLVLNHIRLIITVACRDYDSNYMPVGDKSKGTNWHTKIPYLKFDIVVLHRFDIKSNCCVPKKNRSFGNSEQNDKSNQKLYKKFRSSFFKAINKAPETKTHKVHKQDHKDYQIYIVKFTFYTNPKKIHNPTKLRENTNLESWTQLHPSVADLHQIKIRTQIL